MSKKSILKWIVTIVVGGIFGGATFAAGRSSKASDDNNEAADNYMNSIDGTDDADTDPDDSDEEND